MTKPLPDKGLDEILSNTYLDDWSEQLGYQITHQRRNKLKQAIIDWALGCLPEKETKVSDNFNDGFNRAIEIATQHIKGER